MGRRSTISQAKVIRGAPRRDFRLGLAQVLLLRPCDQRVLVEGEKAEQMERCLFARRAHTCTWANPASSPPACRPPATHPHAPPGHLAPARTWPLSTSDTSLRCGSWCNSVWSFVAVKVSQSNHRAGAPNGCGAVGEVQKALDVRRRAAGRETPGHGLTTPENVSVRTLRKKNERMTE